MSGRIPPIGTLRDRVQLQTKQMALDTAGGHSIVFNPLATVWARVTSLRGRESREASGRAATISHSVVTRFRTDLKPGDRIVYRGRALEIFSAEDLNGRRAYLSCACTETSLVG